MSESMQFSRHTGTVTDHPMSIGFQIVCATDREENGPLLSRQTLERIQNTARHGLPPSRERLHSRAAYALRKLWLRQINKGGCTLGLGNPGLRLVHVSHYRLRSHSPHLLRTFFFANQGFHLPSCL